MLPRTIDTSNVNGESRLVFWDILSKIFKIRKYMTSEMFENEKKVYWLHGHHGSRNCEVLEEFNQRHSALFWKISFLNVTIYGI